MSETLRIESGAAASAPAWTEPRVVPIPEGWFWMGSDAGQENERPVHRVWVGAFELGACQVTNAEYEQFLGATGHRKPLHWGDALFSDPGQPVVAPSWFDAAAYCEWLSERAGRRYRLPTEAEWERAARGGRGGARKPGCTGGARSRWNRLRIMGCGGGRPPSQWVGQSGMATGFS